MIQGEIGERLYLSFNTVKTHIKSIFRELDVSTRRDAVVRARDLGLL
jgi:LuxR family maltose regulon positive regulatory protein